MNKIKCLTCGKEYENIADACTCQPRKEVHYDFTVSSMMLMPKYNKKSIWEK